MRTTALGVTMAALMVTTAWGAGPAGESLWLSANRAAIDRYIVPGYDRLASASGVLEERTAGFCASPDQARLDAVRQAFDGTMDAWMGVQPIRFGPVDLFLRYTRFELWPDPHGIGSRQLDKVLAEGNAELPALERFSRASVAVQGLTAFERLIYGDDGSVAPRDFGTAATQAFRCHLLEAIGHNIAAMSRDIRQEWTAGDTPYRAVLLGAEQGNDAFESSQEVSARFLNNLYASLEVVLDQKLLAPLGASAVKADVRRAESWRSHRSLRNVTLNLQAAEALYVAAFSPLLADKTAVDREMHERFGAAIAASQAVGAPLEEAIRTADGRARLQAVADAVSALKRDVSGQLVGALGLPIGFNSLDGD